MLGEYRSEPHLTWLIVTGLVAAILLGAFAAAVLYAKLESSPSSDAVGHAKGSK